VAGSTHYERLGVTPAASTEEVRAAYRALARRLHPDRLVDATPAERNLAERRMREINEAWRILGDPTSRRRYDDSLVGRQRRPSTGAARGSAPARPAPEIDDGMVEVAGPTTALGAAAMRHLPWMVVLGTLAVIFVVTAYAGIHHDPPPRPEQPPAAGACVDVRAGSVAHEVPCSGPHRYEVVQRVAAATSRPAHSSARRFAGDRWWSCLVRGSTASTTTTGG
jgi:hypothetical protein